MWKYVLVSISLVALLTGGPARGDTTTSTTFVPCDPAKNYALLWDDEFNNPGLPDPAKWGYECGLLRNNELQYYTKGRTNNARVENGTLVIETDKELYANAAYTSASLITFGKASFPVNTRVEVCAKLPFGSGIWPAIWMMGTDITNNHWCNWPQCGEIDIMEFMGCNPGVVSRSFHWMDLNSTNFLRTLNNVVVSDNTNAFHVYGVERTQNSLKFFIDTNYYCTVTADSTMASNLLSKPYYLLINTAFGGSAAGYVDDSILPQKYYISWVRVFDMTSGPLPGP